MINEKIKGFIESPVSNDFGLSIDVIAEKCKTYGRFNSWLNQDISKIKQVLNNVKSAGLSPAFFASYERTEGYNSSWGWLNHTVQKGDYFQDATSVSNVVMTQSNNMSGNPSWIDYGNPVDFVPSSVKNEGNEHFSTLSKGTIGRALIPLTAAATWEVYYPNGLLKEYNKIQNYAKPINLMVDTIIAWGGTINGTIPTDPPDDPVEPVDPPDPPKEVDYTKFIEELNDLIKKMIGSDVFKMGLSGMFKNNYLTLIKQLDNSFKIKTTKPFFDKINEKLNELKDLQPVEPDDPEPVDPEDPEPDDNKPVYPTLSHLPITSEYGYRGDIGVPGASHYHWAIDIGSGGLTTNPIYATQEGIVRNAGTYNNGGIYVIIEHTKDNYWTRYLHLKSYNVTVGETVTKGQTIGIMGASGIGSGIHLDFAVSKNGTFQTDTDTISPRVYLGL